MTKDSHRNGNGHYLPTPDVDPSQSEVSDPKEEEGEGEGRDNWSRKMDFILSCLSYAVGLGNVWRFPYICYKNGGGAFLLPFLIMLFVTGIPLMFLELSFGQYASSGVVSIWSASPIFQGVGWAMFIVSTLIAIYYNMVIAWTLYYFFASFSSDLPWSSCGDWSTEYCLEDTTIIDNCTNSNGSWYNATCFYARDFNDTSAYNEVAKLANLTKDNYVSSSDEYFHKVVLDISDGVNTMGGLRWELVGCLFLAWVLVCICLGKGIKTSGKAVYFTAFFPYLVLTILFVRGLMLDGAGNGVRYYLTPNWEQLLNPVVWKDGAVQIFFSLSPGWGGLITLASYNKFNNNTLKDAVLVSVLDCLTSVFAGLVIFAIIGYMAHTLDQSVDSVVRDGPGLAFIAYPYVVTMLPFSQLWAVLFFAMLITLGLGTQIATVTTIHTTLIDRFSTTFKGSAKRSFVLLVGIAFTAFLIGLSFCTQGGMFIVQLFDNYAATYSLLAIGMVESLALAWVYGCDRFFGDIELMLGRRPHQIWAVSWKFVAPIALATILVFTFATFEATSYGPNYTFPAWADALGLLMSLASILAMPAVAVFKVVAAKRDAPGQSLLSIIRSLSKPTKAWGPRLLKHRLYRAMADDVPASTYTSQQAMMMSGLDQEKV